MSNIFSNVINKIKDQWDKLSKKGKLLLVAIVVLFIGFIIVAFFVGSKPESVSVLTKPITDQALLDKISVRLDEENVSYTLTSDGKILVSGDARAREVRSILIREKLLPTNTDPWDLFDVNRWTQTDFERNVNLRRSITKQIIQHIEALDDIDNAEVTLVTPEDTLFSDDRKPVSASVILNIKPGSDFRDNRKKIEGVQQLILLAVEGLTEDALTISDSSGIRLNDFKNLADFDRLEQTEKEITIRNEVERRYKKAIHESLSDIYTPDRVRIININIEIDFNKKTQKTTENFPIVVKKDNPSTPYDESEVTMSIPRSEKTTLQKYQGTGFNPEGPPGVEGQTPPSYKSLDGIVGDWDSRTSLINNEVNQTVTNQERNYDITRVTASVALDGIWKKNYNVDGTLKVENGGILSRTYYPISSDELQKAQVLVKDAVAYSIDRKDSVSVENVQFDRSAQFALEDAQYRKQQLTKKIVMYTIIALISVVIIFIIIRFFVRIIEDYKARKEERLAEQYRRLREQQIANLTPPEETQPETDIERMVREVQEAMEERPKDIAQLITAWTKSG